MQRRTLVFLALAVLTVPGWAQDKPPVQEKKLTFKMKDASVDAVLQYVSSVTGWIFVQEKPTSGTITAVSDTDVPVSQVLDFLNSALRPHGRVILNPNSPDLPAPGQTLKVLDVSDAMKRGADIHVGFDPKDIPLTDQVRTQIIPLKAVNVIDVQKELGDLLRQALTGTADGTSGSMAVSTYSNSIILTGRSEGINRAVRILRVIDVSTSAELKIKVFPLKNADATETAKTLNDVFKRETMKAETGNANPMSNIWRMFGGGGGGGGGRGDRGEGGGAGGPSPKALAYEMVRITAEVRTNSVIVSATEDNMKIIEDLILRLDDKSAAAIKLKLYALRYADATGVAKLVNDLFAETPTNSQGQRGQNRGGGGMMPVWMGGGGGGAQSDPQGATKEVRAVADLRTNSVLVAASEQRLVLIDAVMTEIDRQVNDLLEVKIYKLTNADPTQMATILQALFRPQVQATQNSGRTTGGGGAQTGGAGMFFGGQAGGGNRGGGGAGSGSGGGALLPSQEVEITADTRTRAVIAKASKEYIAIIDDVVKQLDLDPTETMSTYVIPLRNADASSVAQTLQNLLRSSQTGSGSSNQSSYNQQNRNNQQTGPFSGMQSGNNNNAFGSSGSSSSFGGSSSSRGSSGGRFGNLGPLEGPQDAPASSGQQDDSDLRKGIEGQADIQPDSTTNSLVIRTSPRNFQSIQGLLRDLDRMRPQVLIKVLIADVTLDENTQFGVEGFWEHQVTPNNSGPAQARYGTSFPGFGSSGLTYALTADNGKYQATLNLFASEGKLKVLATPRIMVLDNQTASISVGKDVPRITNSTINSLGNTVNSVTYESVGIILNVTPHINPDGLVTMIVAPEISDVASAAESVPITGDVTSPTFNVNRAQSTVAVRNGTTVVIGGLIRDSLDDTVSKVPILGDIPLLGFLFSNTGKHKIKRELMIFLTPYVAYTAVELEEITQLEKSRLKIMDLRDIEAESDRWLERIR
ncbi:MAG TPA: secretin N-terminal domain-containing protein [Planctomycetota bacterium]|nr:secretin N-terminal domain-containing protein [Planctomycetota bacterium]